MIHLAGIVDEAEAARRACAPGPSAEVVWEVTDQLACAGRWHDGAAPPTTSEALVDHDRMVQRLMGSCHSVVPFRYGTMVEDPETLRAELLPRARQFADLLGWLRGRVELALRAAPAPAPESTTPVSATPAPGETDRDRRGAMYLRALREQARRNPLKELHRVLTASAVAAVAEPDGHGGIKASYLVDAAEVDSFCRLLDLVTADAAGVGSASLTGPWAPYTFAATINDHGQAAVPAGPGRGSHA